MNNQPLVLPTISESGWSIFVTVAVEWIRTGEQTASKGHSPDAIYRR